MIQVEDLSKFYGSVQAVSGLSFEVKKGEVLGFLGPNGAGKTTTMKMLTCYLPPSSGRATIFGFDIMKDSMEVRKRTGYLPEKSPLYTDMRVGEYLSFVAKLRGVPGNKISSSVEMSVEACGLGSVFVKSIGHLSKGFQQRVGIAQAIIHDPELLILDEPTIGLDPKQIIDIRRLITNLGKDRTVILSSHILPEVNQVCGRVIILDKGRLVAVDTPDNLREKLRKFQVTFVVAASSGGGVRTQDILGGIGGVTGVRETALEKDASTYRIESVPDRDLRNEIAVRLVSAGVPLFELRSEEMSLEDIFIQLVTEEKN